MKIPVTVLIQTKNEERAVVSCIQSASEFSEIIVVDSNSKDRTAELAEKAGVRVVNFTWNGRYPKKKQWQLDELKTQNDWVLFLDADERPSRMLVEELAGMKMAEDRREGAFNLSLDYWFAGKKLKFGHRVSKRVLLDRRVCSFTDFGDEEVPGMGELEGHYQPSVRLRRVGELKGRLEHEDRDPVRTWFDRHNKYSTWEASISLRPSISSSISASRSRGGRAFSRVPLKPLVFFLYSYVARLGFLDRRAGFDYAMALSFYYWQIGLKRRELVRTSRAPAGVEA